MLLKYLPWKSFLQRAARRSQFIDPVEFLARLRQFSKPSEVQEPIELIRAGIHFHARGLINTKAIQNNLDWIWPMWVEKQFAPEDPSFIPRAFSISHINLTHRNWTGVGMPGLAVMPIVDPHGLVTPLYDGWSIDFLARAHDGELFIPAKLSHVSQRMNFDNGLAVETTCGNERIAIETKVWVEAIDGHPQCRISAKASGTDARNLIISFRPYNPEGIQYIEAIDYDDKRTFSLNKHNDVIASTKPELVFFSNYIDGDVLRNLWDDADKKTSINCETGMSTAALLFQPNEEMDLTIPLENELKKVEHRKSWTGLTTWDAVMKDTAQMKVPDEQMQFLFDNSMRTLVLLSPDEIVPGPYTYKRFWFRDACIMANSMLAVNLPDRVEQNFPIFLKRQKNNGYFHSQEGEWDSNGQVLWLLERYFKSTGKAPTRDVWYDSVKSAAKWIIRKRDRGEDRDKGLLPPGFSAEHLGPNDYYYWDDFWGVSGLVSAAWLMAEMNDSELATIYSKESEKFRQDLNASIAMIPKRQCNGAIPASPYRRMDSGAVGSLVADFPLQIFGPGDEPIEKTMEWLMEHSFVADGFFQQMIHSGINAYLTIDIAQSLLRRKDERYIKLIRSIADKASPTGNWPEAMHPQTFGGCMGDGHHGWAAAEWVMMMRNLFIREEQDGLILCSGLLPEWLSKPGELAFGPTLTPYGKVSIKLKNSEKSMVVTISANWHAARPPITLEIPGFKTTLMETDELTISKNL